MVEIINTNGRNALAKVVCHWRLAHLCSVSVGEGPLRPLKYLKDSTPLICLKKVDSARIRTRGRPRIGQAWWPLHHRVTIETHFANINIYTDCTMCRHYSRFCSTLNCSTGGTLFADLTQRISQLALQPQHWSFMKRKNIQSFQTSSQSARVNLSPISNLDHGI